MRRALGAIILTVMSAYPAVQHLIEGSPQSPVRVVIYEDLQCPDCADFRVMLDEKLLPRYAATVRFEHHDFPLAKHAWARKAAIAARFFEENQPGLGLAYRKYSMANLREITADNFNDRLSQFAKDHRVDPSKAVAALDDPRLAALVEEDYQEGVARGIAHTPTVLVNGRPFVETFPVEDVAKAIDAELAAAK
jgi:protein-disulfide isomerase